MDDQPNIPPAPGSLPDEAEHSLKRFYELFGAIGLIIIGLIVAIFFSAKGVSGDHTKVADITAIRIAADTYARNNAELPQSLSNLGLIGGAAARAKNYQYRVTGTTTYEVCAVFRTDRSSSENLSTNATNPAKHQKGSQCFASNVTFPSPEYNQPPTPTPTPQPAALQGNSPQTSSALCNTLLPVGARSLTNASLVKVDLAYKTLYYAPYSTTNTLLWNVPPPVYDKNCTFIGITALKTGDIVNGAYNGTSKTIIVLQRQ